MSRALHCLHSVVSLPSEERGLVLVHLSVYLYLKQEYKNHLISRRKKNANRCQKRAIVSIEINA